MKLTMRKMKKEDDTLTSDKFLSFESIIMSKITEENAIFAIFLQSYENSMFYRYYNKISLYALFCKILFDN